MHTRSHRRFGTLDSTLTRRHWICGLVLAAGSLSLLQAGCGDSTMRMQGDLESRVSGDLRTALKIDGPIQVRMEGPSVRYDGTYVPEGLFGYVVAGKTRIDWVRAAIGEPDQSTTLDDQSVIWKWAYVPVEQQVSLLQVLSGTQDEPKLQPAITIMRIQDGVVVEKWRG